jgi:Family of unknown function (DUF6157)
MLNAEGSEVAASTSQRPEKIGVLVRAGVDLRCCGRDHVRSNQVVACQTVLRGQVADPAAEGETAHPGGAHDPSRRAETERLRRQVEVEPCCDWGRTVNSDTFIEVAEDCPAVHAEVPPARAGRATKAAIEYELIAGEPYALTEEDVAFRTRVAMRDIPEADWPAERERFLSQEKPRLRVSALAKRYGWGIHIDSHGRVGLVAVESAEYQRLAADPALRHVRAFRSKHA